MEKSINDLTKEGTPEIQIMLELGVREGVFRQIIEILTVLVEDAKFKFDEEGIEVRAVDAMHVAMVKMNIDASAFEYYNCEGTHRIGMELVKLRDLFRLAEKGQLVQMAYRDGVGVTFQMDAITRIIRPLDRATMLEPRVTDVDLYTTVEMPAAKFSHALRAAKHVGDLATISVANNSFSVNVSGDTDTVNASVSSGRTEGDSAKSQYSLSLLYPMAKRLEAIVDTVTLFFNENHPLRLEYDFADGAGRCVYFLAPRIEGDG